MAVLRPAGRVRLFLAARVRVPPTRTVRTRSGGKSDPCTSLFARGKETSANQSGAASRVRSFARCPPAHRTAPGADVMLVSCAGQPAGRFRPTNEDCDIFTQMLKSARRPACLFEFPLCGRRIAGLHECFPPILTCAPTRSHWGPTSHMCRRIRPMLEYREDSLLHLSPLPVPHLTIFSLLR
jgi:hypothetical protein